MSRRKQTTPRHLDGETPDLAANTTTEVAELDVAMSVPDADDVTLCERCQEEFSSVEELAEHKIVCNALMTDELQLRSPSPNDEDNDKADLDNEEAEAEQQELERHQELDQDQELDQETEYELDQKGCESPQRDIINNDILVTSDEKSDGVSDTKSDNASEHKDDDSTADPAESPADTDDETSEKVASMMAGLDFSGAGSIPPLLSALSDNNMKLVMSDGNVKLEKLESTKVAVAQFAENNLSNLPQMDLPSLQTMLVSLQQQQLMQLQLLQQLQQQLLSGVVPPALAQLAPLMAAASQAGNNVASLLPGMMAPGMVPTPPVSSEKAPNLDRADRPFKCTICSSRFSSKTNLDLHLAKHKTTKVPHGKMPDATMRPSAIPPLIPALQKEALSSGDGKESEFKVTQPTENAASPMSAVPHRSDMAGSKASEAPRRSSPDVMDMAMKSRFMSFPPTSTSSIISSCITTPTMSAPMPMPSFPHPGMPGHPGMLPFGFEPPPFMRSSILPQQEEDPMEQYMECSKSETSKLQALVENIETKLTDPNQCAICQRILSCKSALQMHYRTHTGERPFKCKICGRAFTTKGNLKTHMGVHRAKPPIRMLHQCPVCHKQFTNALVLQQHIRMHTGELPKDMPIPPEMMPAPYMPFPGFPFMSPFMPPHMAAHMPPNQMGASGELDLRKTSPEERPAKMPRLDDSAKEEERERENREHASSDAEDKDSSFRESESAMETEGERSNMGFPDAMSSPSEDEQKRPESDQGTPSSKEGSSPYLKAPGSPRLIIKPEAGSKPSVDLPGLYSSQSSVIMPTSYSTSLMALEERVKAIESPSPLSAYNSMQPLEHMANILRRPDISVPNGKRSPHLSPNEEGSEGHYTPGSKEGSLAPSPAASGASPNLGTESNPDSSDGFPFKSSSQLPLPFMGMSPMDLQPGLFGESTIGTTCNICYKTFACRSALDIHYRSHTKERPFKCEVCERGFTTKGNMRQHMLTHKIRDIPSQGERDEQTTPTKVKEEMIPVSMSTPLKPPSTPGKPDTPRAEDGRVEDSMAAMERMVEQETVRSSAPLPSLSTPAPISTPAVATPPSSRGTDSSPFVKRPNLKHMCLICQKPFSSASALQIHMRTHTGDKPFKCTICGKAFTTKGNLKVHMGTHMWNNQPSRRGRRMSIDGLSPGFNPHRPADKPEFPFPGFPPRPPTDMYPFPPFPGFHNGFSPKMNEISVIQSLNGGIGPLPPTSLPSNIAEVMKAHHQSMADAVKPLPPSSMSAEQLMKTDFMKSEAMKNLMKADPAKSEMMKSPLKHHSDFLKYDHLRPDISRHDELKGHNVENNNNTPLNGSSGELDLSMNKSHSSTPPEDQRSRSPGNAPPTSLYTPHTVSPPSLTSPSHLHHNDKAADFMRMPPSSIPPLHFSSPFPPPGLLASLPSSMATSLATSAVSPLPLNMTSSMSSEQTSPSSSAPSSPPAATSIHMSLSTQSASALSGEHHRPASPQNPAWVWKTTCHICNKTCPSAAALEMHMKGHMQRPEQSSPTPLMT